MNPEEDLEKLEAKSMDDTYEITWQVIQSFAHVAQDCKESKI